VEKLTGFSKVEEAEGEHHPTPQPHGLGLQLGAPQKFSTPASPPRPFPLSLPFPTRHARPVGDA